MRQTLESLSEDLPWERAAEARDRLRPHLVVAWSLDEPDRIGESACVDRRYCLGRGDALPDDPASRVGFQRARPDLADPAPPIANARVSRLHLVLEPIDDERIRFENLSRAPVRVNGREMRQGIVAAGDVLELHNAVVFLVVSKRPVMAPLRNLAETDFGFGKSDRFGMVGESVAAWALRDQLAFAAATDRHVLIRGESGAGKELAARSVHGLSRRAKRPFVARNATTMPETLLDAELFGNAKNYPNPGMPERPGLVGEADTGTLFLDEIGDLPERHQTHLLRVLDSGGEYQRLGEGKPRTSDVRFVAATNRGLDALKHDFLARFTHRIELPGLGERREDLALLLGSILVRIATEQPALASRFFERRAGRLAEPRIAPRLVVLLLRHAFTHHVRELERLVWLAMESAPGDYLDLTPELEAELRIADEPIDDDGGAALPEADAVRDALRDHGGSPTRAAKALGLKNRYVILRLMKKHGIESDLTEEPS